MRTLITRNTQSVPINLMRQIQIFSITQIKVKHSNEAIRSCAPFASLDGMAQLGRLWLPAIGPIRPAREKNGAIWLQHRELKAPMDLTHRAHSYQQFLASPPCRRGGYGDATSVPASSPTSTELLPNLFSSFSLLIYTAVLRFEISSTEKMHLDIIISFP